MGKLKKSTKRLPQSATSNERPLWKNSLSEITKDSQIIKSRTCNLNLILRPIT